MNHSVKISYLVRSLLLASALFLVAGATTVQAQEQKLVSEGIAGYADAKNRAPVLTVSTERTDGGGTKLLADAYIIYPELREFPVKFEFFVNRQLFATQYRSPGLDGPVGVDIGPDVGIPPYNFSVIATIVHPNRSFSSTVEGAVYEQNLATTFTSCTLTQLTEVEGEEVETLYVAQKVTTEQLQNNNIKLEFRGEPQSSGDSVYVSATVIVNDEDSSGSIQVAESEEKLAEAPALSAVGTTTKTDSKLSELALSSSDDTLTLSCS